MFRSKIILILLFLVSTAFAQTDETSSVPEVKPSKDTLNLTTYAISYQSWAELVDIDNGVLSDKTYANYYGLVLTYEKERFFKRFGGVFDAALIFGQANAGSSSGSVLNYQSNYRPWYGAQASYAWAYRISPQVTGSIGPLVLARQITWPDEGTGLNIKSGSAVNFGGVVNLNIRLTRQWEIRQMIGTLAFKASTIWSLGAGYKF